MSEYNKQQVQELGVKIVDLAVALADGVDANDLQAGVNMLMAFMGASESFQADLERAILDTLSGATGHVADLRGRGDKHFPKAVVPKSLT